jgi:uncharacterized protein YqjF (DUF2071 family)
MAPDEPRRPWPAPSSRPLWRQRWREVLFLHWPIDVAILRPLIPAALAIDAFDGQAWLSVVPFRMDRVHPRLLPAMPLVSSFPEINVRTYVTHDRKPGVYFLDIQAGARLGAWLARRLSGLPYRFTPMSMKRVAERVIFRLQTNDGFAVSYEMRSAAGAVARAGTLDHWLLERYCLYCAYSNGDIARGEIDHAPWCVEDVDFELSNGHVLDRRLPLFDRPALAHASAGVAVRAWRFEIIS